MPRVTLYVPDDLKARMDGAGEAINWSAIAQRAFLEVIVTQAVRKDNSDMNSVVERLRASKERIEAADFKFGREYGKTWAKEAAEYDQLERIANFEGNYGDADIDRKTLERLIDPDKVWHEWVDFWGSYGNREPSDAFARGFIEGAAEVYAEVVDELQQKITR